MDIRFRTKKLQRLCNDRKAATRELGDQAAQRLHRRLADIVAAQSLTALSLIPGARPHMLKGDRAGQIAVDVTKSVRIVFEPDHNPVPLTADGGIDRSHVTAITVVFVGDYHE